MTEQPAPLPDAASPSALELARAMIEPQLRLLGRLAEIGMEAAEAVSACARGEIKMTGKGDLILAYSRVSRAVRLTVALQSRLVDALAALEAGPPVVPPSKDAPIDPDYVLKARVERIVERAAEAEHDGDPRAVDKLVREAAERLDDIDVYGDLLDRPMSEIVGRIAEDIGLPLDWARLAEEAWARSEMSGEAGRPLKALLDTLEAPPPLEPTGSGRRRGLRLAATARRGKRAEAAKARGDEPSGRLEVCWTDPDPLPTGQPAGP